MLKHALSFIAELVNSKSNEYFEQAVTGEIQDFSVNCVFGISDSSSKGSNPSYPYLNDITS